MSFAELSLIFKTHSRFCCEMPVNSTRNAYAKQSIFDRSTKLFIVAFGYWIFFAHTLSKLRLFLLTADE